MNTPDKFTLLLPVFLVLFLAECSSPEVKSKSEDDTRLQIGAERMTEYLPMLQEKAVGMVVNHTTVIGSTHLVDSLLSLNVNIKAIYAPEHGFRGNVERGKDIEDGIDTETGVQVFSIYGDSRKPSPAILEGIDIMIFDMQDVGVRFFTYVSTLHYVMEACAENNIPLLILDRPNPIGHLVDGPILNPEFRSFIGMHEVPIAHGMTLGEIGGMINGERWIKDGVQCDINVVKSTNYDHDTRFTFSVRASPNLPDMKSVYLYPSVCLFEGTVVSEGRGTYKPFQQFGAPWFTPKNHQYVPESIPVLALDPKFKGETCYGYDLSSKTIEELQAIDSVNISFLIEFYEKSGMGDEFFGGSFNRLAGNDILKSQIMSGLSEQEIRQSWQSGLDKFLEMRQKYLIYP
ncbi:MAG: DUF1343 domain-containing protein [Bacteroidetes bacterium]|nr:DUF1343 domain-containing protein [Bacteroidota bacterium]MDA1121968.1 DUF1343 domain-containing protein [Bacteroidota bacterium]